MPDDDLRLTETPTVRAQISISRPPQDVFDAFVDPAVTTRFWIVASSGRVEQGAELRWTMNAQGCSG